MAIRDVVTRGYGNGTYDPGVNDIPTRGYTIGAAVVDVTGARVTAFQLYFPGPKEVEVYFPGPKTSEKLS